MSEDEKKGVVRRGKRVRTWELELPVSGVVVELAEVGILTSRQMEVTAGVDMEGRLKTTTQAAFMDNARALIDEFVPRFAPDDFALGDYTDDDLYTIVVALYERGIDLEVARLKKRARERGVVESFPEDPEGAEDGADGVGAEAPTE